MTQRWQRLTFYISHSLNDMWVGKVRTFFVLLCIAAGVASVVSLQTLGVMIDRVLTDNLQELNRGDVRVRANSESREAMDLAQERGHVVLTTVVRPAFTSTGIDALAEWLAERDPDAQITYRHIFPRDFSAGFGIALPGEVPFNLPGYIIDVDSYPLYGQIETIDGRPLAQAIDQSTDIVVSDNAADKYGLAVGQQVRIGGSDETFTIAGLVSVEAEVFSNPESALLGFYYVDHSAMPLFNAYDAERPAAENRFAAELYVKLSQTNPDTVAELVEDLRDEFPYVQTRTTKDVEQLNSQIANAIDDLTLVMGLVSMLIGGIGIIQTIMVIVSRRTTEIAILKTVGVQARQVNALFLTEALLLGVLGSLLGVPLGLVAAFGLEYVGEYFLAASLNWVFAPTAVVRGVVLGVVMTAIFGLLPTLMAGQIRPGRLLRPSETELPRAGVAQMLVALAVIFVVIGFIAWTILGGGLTPNPEDLLLSLGTVGLTTGLAAGIGGAALAAGWPLLYKDREELTHRQRRLRGAVWGVGVVLQTVLQGVLFFALGIILVVLVAARLSGPAVYGTLAVAALIGLALSVLLAREQRHVARTLGGVALGFLGGTLGGVLVGGVIALPFYYLLNALAPAAWVFVVELASNIALVELALILLGMIGGILWLLIALAQHIPAFGSPDVKLALRSLAENRTRVATTTLALVIGVLALSLIVMLTHAIQRSFSTSLELNAGGNAFIFVPPGRDWLSTAGRLEDTLDSVEGVRSYNLATNYVVDFVEVIKADGRHLTKADLQDRINQQLADQGRREGEYDELLDYTLNFIDGRQVTQPGALPNREFRDENRQLQPGDAGQRVVVVTGNEAVRLSGLEAGDTLVFEFPRNIFDPTRRTRRLEFEIVGISHEPLGNLSSTGSNPIYAPLDAFGDLPPDTLGAVVDVEDGQMRALRRAIGAELPNAFVVETALLNQLVNEVIQRFTALPINVAVLAILIAGIVIANSVALSTMERQREFGIMKAVGIHRERILGMLLFENSLMGLLGGTIGVGASILLLIQIWAWLFEGDLSEAIPIGWALGLMALCIVISVVFSVFSAWRASGEKPLNVLRYE